MSIKSGKREKVFKKTGGLCWYCGKEAEQVDHIHPRHLGGEDVFENLAPVCKWCNKSKRHIPLSEWRKKLALAHGMAFSEKQRAYWKSIGIELPPDQIFVFYFEIMSQRS